MFLTWISLLLHANNIQLEKTDFDSQPSLYSLTRNEKSLSFLTVDTPKADTQLDMRVDTRLSVVFEVGLISIIPSSI